MFAQALAFTPHLSSSGFLGCFILKDPSLGFLELFQVIVIVVHQDIPRSMALVLRVNKLLAMAKNIDGLCLIVVNKVFFQFISYSIVLQL